MHVGGGVARRAAHHERQRTEREELDALPLELPAEDGEDGVELVRPAEVEVPREGPNYYRPKPFESKLTGRKRRQEAAEAEQAPSGETVHAGEAQREGQRAAGEAMGDTQPAGRAAGDALNFIC